MKKLIFLMSSILLFSNSILCMQAKKPKKSPGKMVGQASFNTTELKKNFYPTHTDNPYSLHNPCCVAATIFTGALSLFGLFSCLSENNENLYECVYYCSQPATAEIVDEYLNKTS